MLKRFGIGLLLAAVLCGRVVPACAAAERPWRSPEGIRFSYTDLDARHVYIAGSFNNWGNNSGGTVTDPAALMERADDGTWSITLPITAEIVRYKFVTESKDGRFDWHADPAVPDHDRDGNSVLLVPGAVDGQRSVNGALMSVCVSDDTGRVSVILRNPDGTFRDVLVLPKFTVDGAIGGAGVAIETIGDRAAAITWTPAQAGIHDLSAWIEDNSRYFGGGERFNALNQKGYVLSMGSLDRPEDKGSCSYKPVPFIISSRGYAIWLDSTSPSTFDLNATERERIRIHDRAARMRLVIFNGSPAETLAEFTRLTGRPSMPPAWAFAPWKSRDVHRNRDELLADAELTRKHDLPGSVIVIDSPWETGYNDFILNQQQFTDPDSMFKRIKQLGFVPCFWLTPFINDVNNQDMKGITPGASSNYQEAADKGFLVKRPDGTPMTVGWWKGRGGLVDFTNPAATAWWHDQLANTLKWGIAAIKCDDGESNFVEDAVFADGSTAAQMKGRYAQLYLKAAHDFLEQHRPGDHTLISRCGFTGTGQFPFGWAGDNEASFSFDNGLPGVILATQNAALSGMPLWGCDIAGYIGDPTPEVFVRWTQFAAFTPLMMVHMTSNKGPWDFGDEALAIYRTYARLHTRLYPYIAAAAREACDNGIPIIRPMAYAYPDDYQGVNQRYQYLFGPDLLVAPMYQTGTSRQVWIPPGKWSDYWTGEHLEGPRMIEASAPLARIPLYVRDGVVIPMLPADVDTLLQRTPEIDPGVVTLDDHP